MKMETEKEKKEMNQKKVKWKVCFEAKGAIYNVPQTPCLRHINSLAILQAHPLSKPNDPITIRMWSQR
jgi:hypothetical protein